MTRRLVTFALSFALLLPATSAIAAQDDYRSEQIQFVAFSDNSKEFLVRVVDPNMGILYRVHDTKTGEMVKGKGNIAIYDGSGKESSFASRQRRKHEMTQDGVADPVNPKKGVVLMSADRGDKFVIYMMSDETGKIARFDAVEKIKDKDGNVAKASQKAVVWDQKGKYCVVIINQELAAYDRKGAKRDGPAAFSGDFIHAFKFKAFKVKKALGMVGGGDDDD